MNIRRRLFWRVVLVHALAGTLVACGGGSSGGNSGDNGGSSASPQAAGLGSVMIPAWSTPVMDGDNQTLTDFSLSRIKWGTVSGDYSAGSKDVAGTGTIPGNAVTGLSVGATYYFVIYAVDTSGNLSSPSTEYVGVAQ